MIDDEMRGRLATAMKELQAQMATLAATRKEWATLTASGSAANNRVTVTVNASAVITETKFAGDIDDLDYADIAAAVTRAHQRAVSEVTRKAAALIEPASAQVLAGVGPEQFAGELPDPLRPLTTTIQPSTAAPTALRDDDATDPGRGVLRKSW